MKFIKIIVLFCFVGVNTLVAQGLVVLSKKDAVAEILEHNFEIEIVTNNVAIASNNKNLLNSGYLPSLTGNASANYDIQDQEATFQEGQTNIVDGAETTRYSASLNLNYTLFDGLGRYYNYKALKEQYNVSELQARETIETTMLQLFTIYFEVARLTENITVLEEVFANTKRRLQRAEYAFEYGQNNKLDVLNAEVDLVNDSINLLNERQALTNTKRDLNVLSNAPLERNFKIDTIVTFLPTLVIESYMKDAENKNVRLLQAKKNTDISTLNYKANKAIFLPQIGLSGTYGWNEGIFPATNFLASNTTLGFSAGVTLSWNLFDGGSGITTLKNSKIAITNQELFAKQFALEVSRDIVNAKGDYDNRVAIFKLQKQNVLTAQNNYERSNERYKLGQITSVELRQAQLNLLNAETNKLLAKYQAKLAELQVLQLTGQLLNVVF